MSIIPHTKGLFPVSRTQGVSYTHLQGYSVDETLCTYIFHLPVLEDDLSIYQVLLIIMVDTANTCFDFVYLYRALITHFGLSNHQVQVTLIFEAYYFR